MVPSIRELDGKYQGQTLWVIGRGPSLALLETRHIGAGPVIAINQAVEKVETLGLRNDLYSMQKDHFFVAVRFATILLHTRESLPEFPGSMKAYAFDVPDDYGAVWTTPSVAVCVDLAHRWGCAQVVYLCCDAATHGDVGAYGQRPTMPAAYLVHKRIVVEHASKYPEMVVCWERVQ